MRRQGRRLEPEPARSRVLCGAFLAVALVFLELSLAPPPCLDTHCRGGSEDAQDYEKRDTFHERVLSRSDHGNASRRRAETSRIVHGQQGVSDTARHAPVNEYRRDFAGPAARSVRRLSDVGAVPPSAAYRDEELRRVGHLLALRAHGAEAGGGIRILGGDELQSTRLP